MFTLPHLFYLFARSFPHLKWARLYILTVARLRFHSLDEQVNRFEHLVLSGNSIPDKDQRLVAVVFFFALFVSVIHSFVTSQIIFYALAQPKQQHFM